MADDTWRWAGATSPGRIIWMPANSVLVARDSPRSAGFHHQRLHVIEMPDHRDAARDRLLGDDVLHHLPQRRHVVFGDALVIGLADRIDVVLRTGPAVGLADRPLARGRAGHGALPWSAWIGSEQIRIGQN